MLIREKRKAESFLYKISIFFLELSPSRELCRAYSSDSDPGYFSIDFSVSDLKMNSEYSPETPKKIAPVFPNFVQSQERKI